MQNIQFWYKQVSTENCYTHDHLITYCEYDNNGVQNCSKRVCFSKLSKIKLCLKNALQENVKLTLYKINTVFSCSVLQNRTKLAGMMDVLVWVEKNSQEVNTFGIFFKTTENEDNHLF